MPSLESVSLNSAPVRSAVFSIEHLLQAVGLLPYDSLGHQFWPVETLVVRKLFSSLDILQCTAAFTQRTCFRLSDYKKKEAWPSFYAAFCLLV